MANGDLPAMDEPLSLPTTLSYTPESCTVTSTDQLVVGPSDLVFFDSVSPGSKPTFRFIVLRRNNVT